MDEPEITEPDLAEKAAAKVAETAPKPVETPPAKPTPAEVDIKALIQQEVAPYKEAAERQTVMAKFGITDEAQVDLVRKTMKELNISPERAFILARSENPEVFGKIGFDQRRHGMLPPTGSSPKRENAPKEPAYADRVAAAKNAEELRTVSQDEFKKRVLGTMARHYGINTIN